MKDLVDLYITFSKIGVLTFGGGLSMLPMLKYEIVEKHGWATEEEILDYYAIGQCTPGIIAVNTATFIGYKRGGIRGGIVSTLGIISPSFLIIIIIATLLRTRMNHPLLQAALVGVRAVVSALMVRTVWLLCKKSIEDKIGIIIFVTTFVITYLFHISSFVIVALAGLAGLLLSNKSKRTKNH